MVFDICSSTAIIENLRLNGKEEEYGKLIEDIYTFNSAVFSAKGIEVYKFLGDGFILLFDGNYSADGVISHSIFVYSICNDLIKHFIKRFIDIDLPRIGITIGLSYGEIYNLQYKKDSTYEYYGRPINMACRLQGTLKEKEHANKLLIQAEVYRKMKSHALRKIGQERKRVLNNMNNNNNIRCYEYDLELFMDLDYNTVISRISENLIEDEKEKATYKKVYRTIMDRQEKNIQMQIRQRLNKKKDA